MTDFYDKDGNRLSLMEWARLIEDTNYARVAYDEFEDVRVSTVWLGVDYAFATPVPLIFETMIFGGERDGDTFRYSTREQALEAHEVIVKEVKQTLGQR